MLVAGPAIRLPLQSWANYAAYVGQAVCVLAAIWFLLVFPVDWSVQTGSQPVIVLYALGLAVIAVGGVVAPLVAGVTREDLAASEDRAAALETELDEARTERDDARDETADLQATLDALHESQARFELYEDRSEQWRWRLRHRNGNLIADGGEGYTRKHNAQKGMASVRRNALGATTMLFERDAETPEDEELPEADDPFEPFEETESRGTFELYEDEAGQHRWRLRHDNGNVLADGGEGYASRRNVRRAVDGVREYVGPADYLRCDPTGFEVYRDRGGEWRWRLVHRNGNVLADGGEGYTRRNDATRAVDRVRQRAADLDVEVYEDEAGEYRWRLLGGNGQILGDSGEGYDSRGGADDAVERLREHAPDADVLDIGRATFEVYEDRGGEWRWRLRHRNGNVLMDGGEGYASRSGAWEGIESVKRNAPNADADEE